MIIDLDLEKQGDKKMFISERLESIKMNEHGGWTVRFKYSSGFYQYNKARLLFIHDPEVVNLEGRGLYVRNKRVSNIAELLRFTSPQRDFYRVTYTNGYVECLDGRKVYITRTPIDLTGGSTWDYLKKLAAETGLQNNDGSNSLEKGYSLVDVKRDNVPLAQYLGDKRKLATRSMPRQIYYPFGCNASQKTAVEAALCHQVSIVQGPPGTGKTQTILNIIANLLLAGKTILVASNNNAAVENIAEKLQREGLGFLVAQLGNSENKEAFIQQQQPYYPDMEGWALEDASAVKKVAKEALRKVSQGFEDQTKQAQLRAELNALQTERQYNDLLNEAIGQDVSWLKDKSPAGLMALLTRFQQLAERSERPSFWFRLKSAFTLGPQAFSFLKREFAEVIACLEDAYYYAYQSKLEKELVAVTEYLQSINLKQGIQELTNSSSQLLKSEIAKRYSSGGARILFTSKNIKRGTEAFLKEYPIVLSSTYKSNDNINSQYVFDYVIMDEASQIDIKTGALTLSCAMNAVIVGDDKQLPNVVSREEALALTAIRETYQVDDRYDAVTHSFLKSCLEIFKDAPVTLLREHYRCHPKIIEFCNQRFYDGELISMTTDKGEEKVLQVLRTVKGNHARGRFNQREIDVITQEVLPEFHDQGSIGIITPYKDQAQAINQMLGMDIASTVHKYQGRECDTIIMSMVDNSPTEFSDDPNLLNVAISRAKTHLCIVATGNDLPEGSILSQLISYIQYNNFEVKESKLRSVFDLLYTQYTTERLAYQSRHQVSGQLSETLFYDTLLKALNGVGRSELSVLCHYPLERLIADVSLLDAEERAFVKSPLSHVDFLIYNSLTKRPLLVIEVDGWSFHKGSTTQQARDALKDRLLSKYDLPPYRISTTDMVTVDMLRERLATLL